MKPIEIRAVWDYDGKIEKVQTGIYVYSNMTLDEIYDLLRSYESRGERVPTKFEVYMNGFEGDKE